MVLVRVATLVVLMMGALNGCGTSPQELRTADQAAVFITDVARGGHPSDWRPAFADSSAAAEAWAEQSTIHDLGVTLRENGARWACTAAQGVRRTRKLEGIYRKLDPGDEAAVAYAAQQTGASREDVRALIDETLKLSDTTLIKTISSLCRTAKQL